MELLKVADIKVGVRARKDFGDIEGLASSINRYGQLQPIIVDENKELIAGERRLRAVMSLGWEEIEVKYKAELSEIEKREIELEENIKRKEFNWPEEVLALERLYELKQERYGQRVQGTDGTDGYGLKDAGEELDKSIGSISMDLQLARALHEFPQELLIEKSKTSALRKYKILKETQLRREAASRTRDTPVVREANGQNEAEEKPASFDSSQVRKAVFKGRGAIYYGDSRQILSTVPDDAIDCLVTDPPFALGMFKGGDATGDRRLAENTGKMYDDDPHRILDVIDQVMAQCARVLKNDGHGYVFFHHNLYQEIRDILERHFPEKVLATPIIWVKNTPGIGNPNQSWVYAYEPCFFINGGRALVKPQAFNYIRCDTVPPKNKKHPTEKPTMLLRHIVGASCVPGEVVLDPFAGSGSTLSAAVQHGCKFIGIEQEEEFYTRIVDRIAGDIGEADESTGSNGDTDDQHVDEAL